MSSQITTEETFQSINATGIPEPKPDKASSPYFHLSRNYQIPPRLTQLPQEAHQDYLPGSIAAIVIGVILIIAFSVAAVPFFVVRPRRRRAAAVTTGEVLSMIERPGPNEGELSDIPPNEMDAIVAANEMNGGEHGAEFDERRTFNEMEGGYVGTEKCKLASRRRRQFIVMRRKRCLISSDL
jgi:hypothetical protein